jgi:protoporphyrinogen IX oxidase
LMVYHATAGPTSDAAQTFKIMERRLLRSIMTPAMVVSIGLGVWLAIDGGFMADGMPLWLGIKAALVSGLIIVHLLLAWHVRRFAQDENHHGATYFRIINEIPTVLMIGIVIAAVVKPG